MFIASDVNASRLHHGGALCCGRLVEDESLRLTIARRSVRKRRETLLYEP